MNTQEELMQASRDYQRTQFGGWPWEEDAVAFDRSQARPRGVCAPPPASACARCLLLASIALVGSILRSVSS